MGLGEELGDQHETAQMDAVRRRRNKTNRPQHPRRDVCLKFYHILFWCGMEFEKFLPGRDFYSSLAKLQWGRSISLK